MQDISDRGILTQSQIIENVFAQAVQDTASGKTVLADIIEYLNLLDLNSAIIISVFLINGISLYHNFPPKPGDLVINTSVGKIGIPVVSKTDDHKGSVRIKVNGIVKSLQVG